jgi:hypothetical protein
MQLLGSALIYRVKVLLKLEHFLSLFDNMIDII